MTATLRMMLKAALTTVAMVLPLWLPYRVLLLIGRPAHSVALPLWKRILISLGHTAVLFAPLLLLIALVERGVHWYHYGRRPCHGLEDRGWRTHTKQAITTSATTCGLFAILGVGTAAIFGGRGDILAAAAIAASFFVLLTPAVLVMRRLTER